MNSLVLLLALLGGDDFRWSVGPGFQWAVTDRPSQQPVSKTLPDLLAEYKASGGQQAYVRGKTDAQHLVDDHGWTYEEIRGLNVTDLRYLHGASHAGRITPEHVRAPADASRDGQTDAPPSEQPPGQTDKPDITIVSPATWDCPHCPRHRSQKWDEHFDVKFEKRDGLEYYPATEWVDSRGVTRRLYGTYTPSQVLWSYKQTLED